jgi:hypothetical protein
MWVYIKTESNPNLYTVGFYSPVTQCWISESDHDSKEGASRRVNYLNGGSGKSS